jgi:uncharacterized protein
MSHALKLYLFLLALKGMMEKNIKQKTSYNFANFCWDAWCCLSVVGIWPRFIEHRLLSTTSLKLKIPSLPTDLAGLKIVQFSDIHLHPKVSDSFLKKIQNKIAALKPDIILFTGDFLCFSQPHDLDRLKKIFSSFSAPYGCYAILGNHDYAQFVSINEAGEYDVLNASAGSLGRIFKRLWTNTILARKITEKARSVQANEILEKLLKQTPFKLLKNESIKIPVRNSFLNITGLEEYCTGHFNPTQAFSNYDSHFPGIVMSHNPDSVPTLLNYPGEVILCGHTHGGQVNLPWLWKKFTLMENPKLKRGLFNMQDKWVYVNRGVGSIIQFRWLAVPELLLLTLEA